MDQNYLSGDSSSRSGATPQLDSEQTTDLIIERARQLVNQLILERGHDRPPFLPKDYSRLAGIKQILRADLGKTSAVLLRFQDGYVIKVNQNHSVARQNFSGCHEIAHTLFGEPKLEHYLQTIAYRNYNPQRDDELRSKARERLCDIAASELLMPEPVFRKYMSSFGLSIHLIERLANIFMASIEAVTRRIAEVSSEPCIATLWRRQKINAKVLQLAWRAGPANKPKSKNLYMPSHTRVTYPSTLHKAFEQDIPITCHKQFRLDSGVKRIPMESKGFGRGDNRFVVSLAFPNR